LLKRNLRAYPRRGGERHNGEGCRLIHNLIAKETATRDREPRKKKTFGNSKTTNEGL